jgi:hypothetical protein
MSIETRIKESLDKMVDGWQRGDGKLFAQPFSKEAHFVAFDGSIHRGGTSSPHARTRALPLPASAFDRSSVR